MQTEMGGERGREAQEGEGREGERGEEERPRRKRRERGRGERPRKTDPLVGEFTLDYQPLFTGVLVTDRESKVTVPSYVLLLSWSGACCHHKPQLR